MAKTKKILKQMMIFSFSAALTMGNGISVSADPNAEENIPDDVILQTEQSQEEADFFSNNSEIGDFSSGSADSNAESNNTNDSENSDGNNPDNSNTDGRNTDDDKSNSNESDNNNNSNNNEDDNKNGDGNTSLDINNLADGIYSVSGTMLKTDKKTASMSDQAFNHTTKLTVKDGTYSLTLDFKAMDMNGQMGYLGNIKYYKTGYTLDQNGNPQGETEDTEVNSLQKYTDDTVVSDYFGTDYPDIVTFPIIEEAKTDSYVPLQVFIPIMDAIAKGTGTQNVFLKMDWSTLKKTSDDDEVFKDDSSNGSGSNNGNNNGSNNGSNNSSNGSNTNGNGSSNNGNSSIGGNNNNAGNNNENGNTNNSGNNTNNSGYVNNAGLGGNSSLKKTNSSGSGSGSSLNGNSSLKGKSSLSGNSSLKSSDNSGTGTSKTSGTLSSGTLNNSTLEGKNGQEEMTSNTVEAMGNSGSINTSAVTQMSSGSQAEQSSATAWEVSTQQSSAKKAGVMIPVWISAAAAVCGLGYKVKTGTNPERRKKR